MLTVHHHGGLTDEVIVDAHGQVVAASVGLGRLRLVVVTVMNIRLDSCLIAAYIDVIVPADGGVAVNQTLLYLVGLLWRQHQLGGIVNLRRAAPQPSATFITIGLEGHVMLGWQGGSVAHRSWLVTAALLRMTS